jgi:hypothetical protein
MMDSLYGGLSMTNQEALEQLEYAKGIINRQGKDYLDERDFPVLECAIEALEKQIPKKPVKSKKPRYGMGYDYYDWECPTCGSFLAFEPDLDRLKKVHHCKCGQAISYVED